MVVFCRRIQPQSSNKAKEGTKRHLLERVRSKIGNPPKKERERTQQKSIKEMTLPKKKTGHLNLDG